MVKVLDVFCSSLLKIWKCDVGPTTIWLAAPNDLPLLIPCVTNLIDSNIALLSYLRHALDSAHKKSELHVKMFTLILVRRNYKKKANQHNYMQHRPASGYNWQSWSNIFHISPRALLCTVLINWQVFPWQGASKVDHASFWTGKLFLCMAGKEYWKKNCALRHCLLRTSSSRKICPWPALHTSQNKLVKENVSMASRTHEQTKLINDLLQKKPVHCTHRREKLQRNLSRKQIEI